MRCRVVLPPEPVGLEGVGPTTGFLYLVAQATGGSWVAELARIAGMDRCYLGGVRGELARAGWTKPVRCGTRDNPVPVCPAEV